MKPSLVAFFALACTVVIACGGDSPTPPTTPPIVTPPVTTPTPPVGPAFAWSVNGTVVETASRAPIAGAQIAPSWELAAVTSGSDGTYQLGALVNPPTGPYDVTVSANGYISRKMWITWQYGPRNGVTLDLIRNAAPFSSVFYGELVRGRHDQEDAPWRLLRLTTAPKFYIKTVDEKGIALAPEIFPLIQDAIRRAVQDYTGGRFSAPVIETGTATRAEAPGWINVNIIREEEDDNVCGRAFVGADPGRITLVYDRPGCRCGSLKVAGPVVAHEVGHALGFFHVSDRKSLMYPITSGACPVSSASAVELYHAAIAYSRPRGNTEPDDDPSTGPTSLSGDGPGRRILVKN